MSAIVRALVVVAIAICNVEVASAQISTSSMTMAVSDRVPHLNVEATCKATTATDKAMGLALPQSYDECIRDENTAQ